MSETVFILGAGASNSAGAPMMSNFLDVAQRLVKQNDLGEDTDDFRLVLQGRSALQLAYSKANIDIDNIESVFAAFEMAKLLGRLDDLTATQVERLPTAMRRVISRTLEETILLKSSHAGIESPQSYHQLLRLISDTTSGRNAVIPGRHGGYESFSIITFNYDVCVDFASLQASIPIDYCLGSFKGHGVKLLKLHGSLNWAKCSSCKGLVAQEMSAICGSLIGSRLEGPVKLPIARAMKQFHHCGVEGVVGPYVVPPTWNKAQYHDELQLVWRAAAEELSNAENVFVFGYSLPETDQFFKYLYALGTIGSVLIKKFWVIDPEPKVEKRFQDLLGRSVMSRFQFFPKKLEEVFHKVRSEFNLTSN